MARLTGCCCCFGNLRDGSRAIGITLLVLGSIGLLGQLVGIGNMVQERQLGTGEIVILVLQILSSVLSIVLNSLLLHGVEKNNRGMLLAWLIYHGFMYCLASIGVIAGFIIFCVVGVIWAALLMLGVAALVGVFWYWFVVVLHCYLEMREENGFVYGKQDNEGERHAL